AALDKVDTGMEPAIRRVSAEQSNSSLIVEDIMVLKVIRRLSPGIHPEAEMGRYLTVLGYGNTPAMLGEVTRIAKDGTPYTMLLLQQYIHNQGDGWQWVLDTLVLSIQQAAVTEAGAPEPAAGLLNPEDDLTQLATMLGRRLGEMHIALATPTDDINFAPQVATEEDTNAWADGARQQLDLAFEVLRAKHDWSNPDDARRAGELLEKREQLFAKINVLAAQGIGTQRIRIHGDFHLGQVLIAQGDVYIVDFEGEPVKQVEQRRQKNSPMRDVAGLLRSYDYAAAFAGGAGPGDLSEAAELRKRQLILSFAPTSQAAFLRAYNEVVYGGPRQSSKEAEQSLLQLFVLEKAAYEICYEAANRPDWLPVPMNGLVKIVNDMLATTQGGTSHE
ncbi:MAG: putative maltokinase, partial [Burkholderiaceae bacterium]